MNDRAQCYDLSGAVLPLYFFRKAQEAKEKRERQRSRETFILPNGSLPRPEGLGHARALRVARIGEDALSPYVRRVEEPR